MSSKVITNILVNEKGFGEESNLGADPKCVSSQVRHFFYGYRRLEEECFTALGVCPTIFTTKSI